MGFQGKIDLSNKKMRRKTEKPIVERKVVGKRITVTTKQGSGVERVSQYRNLKRRSEIERISTERRRPKKYIRHRKNTSYRRSENDQPKESENYNSENLDKILEDYMSGGDNKMDENEKDPETQ